MDSLVGYGSDDDGESGRYSHHPSGGGAGGEGAARRRDDDTNYDDVNMDMSEESQEGESEPELPAAAPEPERRPSLPDASASTDKNRKGAQGLSDGSRSRSRSSDRRDKRRDRDRDRERARDRDHRERERHERERRSPRRDERAARPERRRGLLGDRPDDRAEPKVPPTRPQVPPMRPQDARDAVSHRFVDRRDRDRDRERERERERDRDGRPARRSEERRSGERERRGSPPADYRPSSYKVNRKLEVMEKMGLQIKTPDGSMATARQLRAAALPAGAPAPGPPPPPGLRALHQVQKRKLLWAHKEKGAADAEAARWSGARFAQDSDGKQVSKFMRLMGIKDPNAVKSDSVDSTQDPNKKQEELFQAMQAQYEVARATTHTMRGVGLGFQRGNF